VIHNHNYDHNNAFVELSITATTKFQSYNLLQFTYSQFQFSFEFISVTNQTSVVVWNVEKKQMRYLIVCSLVGDSINSKRYTNDQNNLIVLSNVKYKPYNIHQQLKYLYNSFSWLVQTKSLTLYNRNSRSQ